MQAARKILSTRQGTLGFAAAAAALAIVVLLVFMQSYKRSLDQRADPVTVLVAKGELPRGSSGDVVAGKGLFKATGFKREQVREGAITDPSSLRASVDFAELLQRAAMASLERGYPDVPDGGVRRAGFYVLAGARMPAVLFETSFISNKAGELQLNTGDFRQKLADSIVNAVRAYRDGF